MTLQSPCRVPSTAVRGRGWADSREHVAAQTTRTSDQGRPCFRAAPVLSHRGYLLHVILPLLIVELALLLGRRVLVLLVLRHKVVHVRFRLSELHLAHALTGVPMQERLAAEHCREIFGHALEHLLDCCRVPCESHCHLQAFRRN